MLNLPNPPWQYSQHQTRAKKYKSVYLKVCIYQLTIPLIYRMVQCKAAIHLQLLQVNGHQDKATGKQDIILTLNNLINIVM